MLGSIAIAGETRGTPLAIALSVAILYLMAVILLAEGLSRWRGETDAELTRKIVHIGTGNVILLAWWLSIPTWVGVAASAIASAMALISYFVPVLPSLNSVGRRSLGTFFYAIAIGILVAWFWPLELPQYAAIGIAMMAWGDGLAALVGQNFGRHRYQVWGATKSWEGSGAMAIASYLVCSAILWGVQGPVWQTWVVAAIVAAIATALEAVSQLGIDNLSVPIASAAICFWLEKWLLG